MNRLAAQYPDKTVFCLDPVVCPCSTMYRIHPAYLAWALENIEQGNIVNRITVDDDTAREAKGGSGAHAPGAPVIASSRQREHINNIEEAAQ